MYYYGARYYNPQLSIWLSVDPLAEKFPNWNPYNYVMQNPINLIDPTGMSPEGGGDGDPIAYRGTGVAVGDNVVNELDGVVLEGDRKSKTTSWNTESERYSYNGTRAQWESHYGMNANDYTTEMAVAYKNYIVQLDLEEQNRILLEKLGLFLTYFYIAEDVIYIHTAGVALSQVTNAIKALKKSNPNFKVKVISTVDDAARGVSVMADLSERFPGFEPLVTRIGGSASKSEIYPALQKIAKGDWIKVYQGGHTKW